MKRPLLGALAALACTGFALLLLAGPQNPQVEADPGIPIRDRDDQLAISCAHTVIDRELIAGVIVVTNVGTKPLSLLKRWTNWGTDQWMITIGSAAYGLERMQVVYTSLPQMTVELAPGESRKATFFIARTAASNYSHQSPDAWDFVDNPKHRSIEGHGGSHGLPTTFRKGMPIVLSLIGHPLGSAADTDVAPQVPAAEIIREFRDARSRPRLAPLWSGGLNVMSVQVDSVAELGKRGRGADSRTLSDDL